MKEGRKEGRKETGFEVIDQLLLIGREGRKEGR
jgi:hypothetical protein